MVAVRGDHLVAVSGVDSDAGGRAVVLRDGHALASSSWNALIWSNDDGAAAHHLIDPATGAPAEPASAVVIASDAGEADALATALAVQPRARFAPDDRARWSTPPRASATPPPGRLVAV